MLDSTVISNNIIKNSRVTNYSYTRYIVFYKEKTIKYFRKISCYFLVISEDINSNLYKD
jgi:hypothetical protein